MLTRGRAGRLSLALVALVVAGCGSGEPQRPPAPEVTVARPERREVVQFFEVTGTTRAIEAADVVARVPGVLERVAFQPSSIVTRDQLLFVIEQAQYRATRDQELAALRSARADSALAESNLERVLMAAETDAVSEQDVDRATAERDAANAAVLGARSRLARAQLDLDYTEVRSPIDGVVSRNLVDVGNLVGQSGQTLLTTVNKVDSLYVYFNLPEQVVLQYREVLQDTSAAALEQRRLVGQAWIGTSTEDGYPHPGLVDFIDNTVNPATGTIEVRLVVPNQERILLPGIFVRVRVAGLVEEDALLVQERGVGADLGGKYVMLVGPEGVVEQRYVELGPIQDDGSVVVETGLEGNETYIVNGLLRARPGFPVAPRTAQEVAAEQAAAARQAEDEGNPTRAPDDPEADPASEAGGE